MSMVFAMKDKFGVQGLLSIGEVSYRERHFVIGAEVRRGDDKNRIAVLALKTIGRCSDSPSESRSAI
jgi:hypothetical protein